MSILPHFANPASPPRSPSAPTPPHPQYYFETIFPRIPKRIEQDIQDKLRDRGLPTVPRKNGGQGGPDRRGVDEPNKRPASVKASLSVSFG